MIEIDTDIIAHLPLWTGGEVFKFDKSLYEELLSYDTLLQTGDSRSSYVWQRKEVILRARGRTKEDFFNVTTTTNSWYDRYKFQTEIPYIVNPAFSPELKKEVERLLDFIRRRIPINPLHLTLVNSTGETPAHVDCPPEQRKHFYNKGLEPANVKMILNVEEYDDTLYFSRYMSPEEKIIMEKEKHIPADTNTFAWSENFHPHVGFIKPGTSRMLINVFGVLDKPKYKILLKRSLERYMNYVIKFDMDTYDGSYNYNI